MSSPPGVPLLPLTEPELAQYYGDAPNGVRANMVQTVDGADAFQGRTKRITDPADQALLLHLRSHADAVLVGGTTVLAEKYGPVRLDATARQRRLHAGYAETPPIVVITARAELPTDLRLFDPSAPPPIIMTRPDAAASHPELNEVADVVSLGDDELDPRRVVAALHDRGLHRILCEGGPFVLSRLIEHDLVDDMCLTVSPFLAGRQPTTAQPPSTLETPTRLRLRHVLTRNDLLYLRYSTFDD